MTPLLPLEKMSVEEKIQTIEMIWDDLCRLPNNVKSPHWHQEVLADRKAAIDRGKETFEDWETAKKSIRKQIS